jgi:hypothetical protein
MIDLFLTFLLGLAFWRWLHGPTERPVNEARTVRRW